MSKWLRRILPIIFLLSVIGFYFGNKEVDRQSIMKNLTQEIASQLKSDSLVINRYLQSADDKTILTDLEKSFLSTKVYRDDSIKYWNSVVSEDQHVNNNDLTIGIVKNNASSATISFNVKALNNKLSDKGIKVMANKTPEYITIAGKMFGIQFEKPDNFGIFISFSWVLLFLTFIGLTYLLASQIKKNASTGASIKAPMFLIILLFWLFKGLHYWQPFLSITDELSLTHKLNYTSWISQSIAHLMINLWIFGVGIYLVDVFIRSVRLNRKTLYLATAFTGLYTILIFGFSTNIIEGFVLSNDINLEIESLMEFNTNSFLLIICFSVLMMMVFQSTHMCFDLINQSTMPLIHKLGLNILGWVIGLALLSVLDRLHVPVWIFLLFIMSYALILDAYTENKDKKITYLIWWLIMFSGFLAVVLFYFGLKKDITDRTQFLEYYYAESDDRIVQQMISFQDSLIARKVPELIASLDASSKLDMKDLHQFMFKKLPDYDDDFEVSIELFDKNSGTTLFNNHFADYFKLEQTFVNSRQVGRQLYHNPFEDKYISRFEILRSFENNSSWYLYIIYQNKALKTDTKKYQRKYGYAVFSKGKLIEKSENNQAAPELSQLMSMGENKITGGYSYVISKPSDQYRIISWKKVSGLIKPISLFSFIFTLSGMLLLLLSLANTSYKFLPENISLKFGSRSSLKTKIQLAIILLILVTFLIIGAITGFYFKNLIEANQSIKNREETSSVINNVRSDIQNLVDDEYALTFLNSKLKELSFIHDKELSLYDRFGKLISTTSSDEVALRVPFDIFRFSADRVYDYKSSALPSQRAYVPLYLNELDAFGYLGINHEMYNNSSGNILDFLSTILNAYIFLFLIAGAIAITIANSITQPLTILAEKLKKFKLGKSNEQLEWKSNDEIGTLIHDYNNLTHELERSAGLLAKTERDMAWREMAKQVAHEIKNPLTPMKLSIQYLDRAAKDYPEKAQEMIPRISSTLIEQIDNLSQIANEFSNFASMPQASNEKVILNEIVETIHDLFRKRDDMDINMIEPIDDLYVFADKNHLVRILNNLLKNAIQAIPENRRGRVEIELKRQGNDALIRISDNGSGIPDHMKDKVFTPNFTTKSSGTGLGLAISANMIESFNGRIYFETKVGQGTDFFVSIPLMRLDDYISDENRVSLD